MSIKNFFRPGKGEAQGEAMSLSCREMEDILMKELRQCHHPIAVTWMFTDDEMREFAHKTPHVSRSNPWPSASGK